MFRVRKCILVSPENVIPDLGRWLAQLQIHRFGNLLLEIALYNLSVFSLTTGTTVAYLDCVDHLFGLVLPQLISN